MKDAFHGDNSPATSVDVGVFWFGAINEGRHFGVEFTKVIDRPMRARRSGQDRGRTRTRGPA